MNRIIELMVRNTKSEKKYKKYISFVLLLRRTIEKGKKIWMNEKIIIFIFLTKKNLLKGQDYKTHFLTIVGVKCMKIVDFRSKTVFSNICYLGVCLHTYQILTKPVLKPEIFNFYAFDAKIVKKCVFIVFIL